MGINIVTSMKHTSLF